jgi:ribulose bisphosphate carboxylase small subunit
VVRLWSAADAECVAAALAPHVARVKETDKGCWDVHVDIRFHWRGDVLTALHDCMVENEIRLVRVTVDEKVYAMEVATAD